MDVQEPPQEKLKIIDADKKVYSGFNNQGEYELDKDENYLKFVQDQKEELLANPLLKPQELGDRPHSLANEPFMLPGFDKDKEMCDYSYLTSHIKVSSNPEDEAYLNFIQRQRDKLNEKQAIQDNIDDFNFNKGYYVKVVSKPEEPTAAASSVEGSQASEGGTERCGKDKCKEEVHTKVLRELANIRQMADDLQKHEYDMPSHVNIVTDAKDAKDNSLMTTEFRDLHYTDMIYAFRQRNREMYCHYLSYEDERKILQRQYLKSKKMLFSQKECLLCN